jgi:acyl dehydratase
MAHTYDSLSVGDSYSWSRTLSMDDVRAFADVTGDDNPIHIDGEAGRQSRFGRPVVHGVYLLGLASKVLGRDFPGPGSIAVSLSAKFLRPVPVGEEVTIEVKVAEKIQTRGHLRIRMYAYCNGKMALGGEAVVIPPPDEDA